MGIGDLFRPKHKHSEATVRAAAVRDLSPAEAETLLEIARGDEDPGVRAAAIEKISDPEALVDLSATESLAPLRDRAGERAAAIFAERALAADDDRAGRLAVARVADLESQRSLAEVARRAEREAVRAAALAKIRDPKVLADVARNAEDPGTRGAALDRIDDADALRAIAVDETRKEIALAALDRIEARSLLEVVASKAKHRGVRARAQKRLKELRSDDAGVDPEKLRHAERVQLCRVVEKLARGHEWVRSHRRVTRAQADWQELGDGADRALADRFRRACDEYFARYEKYGKKSAEAVAARRSRAPETPAVEPEAPAGANDPEGGREEPADAAEAPESAGPPKASPEDQARRTEERDKNLAELEKLTARLEELAGSVDKLKTGERWISRAERAARDLGPLPAARKKDALAAFEEARRKLVIRVGELREAEDWKRWANVPKQEELIARVEALLASEDETSLAPELKKAQREWKAVGPVPRDRAQALWDRFKSACDQVYARVKEHRARLAEEQKENLRKKEELCLQAEELSDSTDWGPTAEALKRLQGEWKKIGPVPKRQSDKIWKRFRAACDRFFERRRPHLDKLMAERTANLERKQALCEELEALAEAEDPDQAVRKLGDFRRRFREIGPVPQKELSGIQKRFREGCERVERRRDEERERERTEARGAALEAHAALEEALGAEAPEPSGVAERALALRDAQKKLLALAGGEEADETRRRADELCARAVEAHPGAFKGTDLDPEVSRKRKEKLVARVEELVQSAEEPPPATAEEMAERLRAALADRALGGVLSKSAEARPVEEVVREARESWTRLGPVPGPEGAALEARFEEACRRARGDQTVR